MKINEDGTVEIGGQTFTPRYKVSSLCNIRWMDDMPYPEIYCAGGCWVPLEKNESEEDAEIGGGDGRLKTSCIGNLFQMRKTFYYRRFALIPNKTSIEDDSVHSGQWFTASDFLSALTDWNRTMIPTPLKWFYGPITEQEYHDLRNTNHPQ